MIPAGAGPSCCQRGNRFSSAMVSARPTGRNPISAISTSGAAARGQPQRAKRVRVRTRPTMPARMTTLDGSSKNASSLETTKNIAQPMLCSFEAAPPILVARLRLVVRRIEAGQLHALLHLGEHPALVELVLGPFMGDELDEVLGDHHRAVVVDHDVVLREHGDAAAADRLVPAAEGEPVG